MIPITREKQIPRGARNDMRVRVGGYYASWGFWNSSRVMSPWIPVSHNCLPFGVFSEMLILGRIKGDYVLDTD